MRFSFQNCFAPNAGDSFEFLNADLLILPADPADLEFTVDGLQEGFEFDVSFDATGIKFEATANGVPEFCEPIIVVIDEDSIDNGSPPNFFTDVQVNDDIAALGLRTQLPVFAANVGETITLHTGELGDEGNDYFDRVVNDYPESSAARKIRIQRGEEEEKFVPVRTCEAPCAVIKY